MEFIKNHKKKIAAIVGAAVLYGLSMWLGIDVNISDVFGGNVGDLGEALEAGAAAVPAE